MHPIRQMIKSAVFQLNPWKAPGIDGFPDLFFQKYWRVVGSAFITTVLNFLNEGIWDTSNNISIITLVPKVKNVQTMNDLRPISLNGTLVKVIYKVLVNRLQNILPEVISEISMLLSKGG